MEVALLRRRGILILIVALFFVIFLFYELAASNDLHRLGVAPSPSIERPQWLIATMSPAHSIQRRIIIRQTWQKLFANPSLWSTRFVISRAANPTWQAIIDAENATYGDIIQLNHLEESGHIANTIKTFQFFKYLVSMGTKMNQWKFISKIDDDSYLDAKAFYRDYLSQRLDSNRTIISRTIHMPNYTAPGGQFYTLTYDLVPLLVESYAANPIRNEFEDVLVGRLLYEANEEWRHIDLPNPIAFDYKDTELREEGEAFAAADADLSVWSHAVGPQAINPHKMKDDETYVKVAACFNENGVVIDTERSAEQLFQ